jgi:hypothetical protein
MNNVIPFSSTRPGSTVMPFTDAGIDDDELQVRQWELVMCGRRGSEEYRRIEGEISHRKSRSLLRHHEPAF